MTVMTAMGELILHSERGVISFQPFMLNKILVKFSFFKAKTIRVREQTGKQAQLYTRSNSENTHTHIE